MIDTVVRQIGNTAEVKEPVAVAKESSVDGEAKIETPYKDYEGNFIAEHYKLGDKLDVFDDELSTIDEYIEGLINSGKIANSVKAVEKTLRDMEKLTNVKDEERSVVKIETIKAHIDFLNKTEHIYESFGKYN